MEDWKQELEEILEEETDMGRNMIPKYARGYARIILENFISKELSKAREKGFNEGVERTVSVVQEGLDELLLEKDGEKYWVGDILRDCGYTVEKIIPKNMKGYLAKLKQ